MKKKILGLLMMLFVLTASYANINAMPVKKEYTDNIQRSVVKYKTNTNYANNKYNRVSPNSKMYLKYRVGNKLAAATFTSSNKKVATVNSRTGAVSFKKSGKVTIYVKGSDGRNLRAKFEIDGVYVTVSIKSQVASIYRGGKRLRKVPIVTGRSGVYDTPKGTFKLAYKQRNTYLDGATVGFDYYLPVKYWMPLANTGGVGFHDASWRGAKQFGGKYYLYDGSHGCINMRTKDAAFFYKTMKAGTTIKIY